VEKSGANGELGVVGEYAADILEGIVFGRIVEAR
jgi:hypothetical protein